MKPLPEEVISSAFVLANGEYAWQRSAISDVLQSIADTGQATLGGDVWVIKNGETHSLFSDKAGMRLWDTSPYVAGELWLDYCRRACDESIRKIEETKIDNAVEKENQQYIFYSPTYIKQNDVKALIPRSKMDVERAEAAVAAGYPAVAPILSELLEWLQDMNWLVAKVLAPFLASIGSPIIPYIRHILRTDDEIWKYWIMVYIISESREVAEAFRADIERFAYSPTENQILEGLDEEARSLLKEHGWHKAD